MFTTLTLTNGKRLPFWRVAKALAKPTETPAPSNPRGTLPLIPKTHKDTK